MNHDHSSNGGYTRHLVLMLLCCLIPLALIAAVAIFGFSLGALTPYLPFAMVLICPLMMFFMMRGMGHDHGTDDTHHVNTRNVAPTQQIVAPTPRIKDLPPDVIQTNAAPPRDECH